MQLRARTRCPLTADNSHTSELRSVFSDVHAAGENDLIDFSLASEKLCEAFFDTLVARQSQALPRCFLFMPVVP